MRRSIIAFACCIGLGGSLAGQQSQTTFKSGVTLVTIDVSVLDKDEKPVPGLTAADFEVKLNGKVQPVRALSYVKAQGTGDAPTIIDARAQSLETGTTVRKGRQTVENGAPPGESRVFVLLVDDLSFAPLGGRDLFLSGRRFVEGLPTSDLVGFATTSGLGAVNPTVDRAPIASALGKVVGQFNDPRGITPGIPLYGSKNEGPQAAAPDAPPGIGESLEIDDGNQTLLKDVITRECFGGSTTATAGITVESLIATSDCAAEVRRQVQRTAGLTRQSTNRQIQGYVAVVKAMGSIGGSGIKELMILSDGLAVSKDGTALLAPLALAAAASGIRITVMLEQHDMSLADEGRRPPPPQYPDQHPGSDTGMAQRRREDDRALTNGVMLVADMTGGDFKRIIGSPDPFFDRTAIAASAIYRVGVEEPAGSAPGKDFGVAVKVNRPGVTVRVNKRAVVATATNGAAPGAMSMEEQLRAAINNGQPLYNVPISTATALRRSPSGTPLDLGVNVAVPSRMKGPLIAMFGLVDEANSVRTGRKTIEAPADGSNYRLSFSIPVTTGSYKLRVAVADATGSVGSIETPIDAKLDTMGPFDASDLLTSWTDSAGKSQFLALEDVPANVNTLNASLELYPSGGAASPDDVKVRIGLYLRGKPDPVAEKNVEPDTVDGSLRADAQFELGPLAPGNYILRAVVSVAGKEVGNTQASLRKR